MNDRIITDISDFIFVSDSPEKCDVIFLPGSSYPEAPEFAAKLYHEGYADLLVPAGGVSVKSDKWKGVSAKSDIYTGDYKTDCQFFTDVLVRNNVPYSSIIGEDRSGHTRDNAFMSRSLLDEKCIFPQKAIIVCKAFHARRCLMFYKLAFPDMELLVCPIHSFNITKENWYKSEYGIKRVLGELARCGNQFEADIMNYLGFNFLIQ